MPRLRNVDLRATVPALALAALVVTTAACRADRVVLTFRPPPGRTFAYTVNVATVTTVDVPGQPASQPSPPVELRATQVALPRGSSDEVRVQITLAVPGAAARTYVARFDRAAQLTDIERVEGIPTEALGHLGLSEIFPAAAGAPPARSLRPGDTWSVDEAVRLPDSSQPVALRGRGKLVELGVIDGHRTATVHTSTTLPLTTTTSTSSGTQRLDGTQTTDLDASYDVTDGSIVTGRAVTIGRFALTLSPPAGTPGEPIHGRLTIEVRTSIERRG